jgi:hypothetical protein
MPAASAPLQLVVSALPQSPLMKRSRRTAYWSIYMCSSVLSPSESAGLQCAAACGPGCRCALLHLAQHNCQQDSCFHIPQAVNEDGVLAWTRVTVLRSFRPQLPDTPFLRMTTAAGQVLTNCNVSPHGPSATTDFHAAGCSCHPARHCKQPLQKVGQTPLSAQSRGQLSCMPFCSLALSHV